MVLEEAYLWTVRCWSACVRMVAAGTLRVSWKCSCERTAAGGVDHRNDRDYGCGDVTVFSQERLAEVAMQGDNLAIGP